MGVFYPNFIEFGFGPFWEIHSRSNTVEIFFTAHNIVSALKFEIFREAYRVALFELQIGLVIEGLVPELKCKDKGLGQVNCMLGLNLGFTYFFNFFFKLL